ncbi:hypothetical protein EYZ11_010877 [Aspergillus tanneri]|uniref:ER membrane protein complex subunit 7 beta-sandwich domain-containing protein n=1 Tax=Aspergillus tanneri TaxID=1220188 RepID=A0A4S3J4B7_9EURO|nr:hypothetical protein EYZ11_010877 [Aspergillus tanneri]
MYLSISTLRLLLVFLATFTTRVFSALTITVTPSNQLPNPNSLPAGTHATLTSLPTSRHGEENYNAVLHPLTAPLTRSGTFIFWDLRSPKPESYLLDIHSAEYVFPPLRVDVSVDGKVLGIWETFRGNPWENRGAEKFAVTTATSETTTEVLDVAVEIKPLARRGFYEERAKFSPLALFKNPMILMALVAMGFTFGMPKLMENMPREMLWLAVVVHRLALTSLDGWLAQLQELRLAKDPPLAETLETIYEGDDHSSSLNT